MIALREYDTIRVVRLHSRNRPFAGTEEVVRAPRIGDVAVIVHEYRADDPSAAVIVEMTDEKGYAIWLADFERDELELVSRPG